MSFVGAHNTYIIRENHVFEKTNEVLINEGRWLVTLVHDLQPFQTMIGNLDYQMTEIKSVLYSVTEWYQNNYVGYFETFSSLTVEIELLNDTFTSIQDRFENYQIISGTTSLRSKRSLLPIIGDAMSLLFGTVSENDLEQIDRSIEALATNQKQIIHDLETTMSVLNLTRFELARNRRSLMEIVTCIQKLDDKINSLKDMFETKFVRLEQFVHTYLQFQMIIDEFKLSIQNALTYLENLKIELNVLAMHHLSTGIITPSDLKTILLEIEVKLPSNFELPANPRNDIWHYYKTIMSFAYLERDQIRIVLQIPLLKSTEIFEVYRVHNLPLPLPNVEETTMSKKAYTAKYNIESEKLMISKSRSLYAFLDAETFKMCSNPFIQYCDPKTTFYRTSLRETCVTSLFLEQHEIKENLCHSNVQFNRLPIAEYLGTGIWVLVNNEPVTITINCRNSKTIPVIKNVKVPFDILKLDNACHATNKYFELPEYFEKGSFHKITDPMKILLTLHNISKFHAWSEFQLSFPNLTNVIIPERLSNLQEIPMIDFIDHIRNYQTIPSPKTDHTVHYSVGIIVVFVLLIIIVVLFIKCKCLRRLFLCLCNNKPKHKLRNSLTGSQPASTTDEEETEVLSVVEPHQYDDVEVANQTTDISGKERQNSSTTSAPKRTETIQDALARQPPSLLSFGRGQALHLALLKDRILQQGKGTPRNQK